MLIGVVAIVALVIAIGIGFAITSRRRPAPPPDIERRPSARPREEEVRRPVERPRPDVEVAPRPGGPPEAAVAPRPTLRDRLAKTRAFLTGRLVDVFGEGTSDEVWDDLEAVLIQADVGVDAATKIARDIRAQAGEGRITDPREIRGLLAQELVSLFDIEADRALSFAPEGPTVWLVVGVNGTGKTTTIGKLAKSITERGQSAALAAADTFRAAADEQLAVWAKRSGAGIIKHQPGADPGAVAFDAVRHANAKGIDVLIVDTAGRLHTKTPLMDELAKVRRVVEKEASIQECLLVIDATAGQNGLVQAREFAKATGVTGVVLSKLDGTAKGGIALAIERDLGIPIKLIGVGESIDDLEPFDPKTFVDALMS
jgi:fused signal recognition particle receptor